MVARAGECGDRRIEVGDPGAGHFARPRAVVAAVEREQFVDFPEGMLHVVAAAVWLGALLGFVLLLRAAQERDQLIELHAALERFSAIGVPLVLVLMLSGLANSWFLVGWDRLNTLPAAPYGRLLLAKIAAFALMLVLAVHNRYRLTPALAARLDAPTVGRLRRNIGLEAAFGILALALVAWFGTLAPPTVG